MVRAGSPWCQPHHLLLPPRLQSPPEAGKPLPTTPLAPRIPAASAKRCWDLGGPEQEPQRARALGRAPARCCRPAPLLTPVPCFRDQDGAGFLRPTHRLHDQAGRCCGTPAEGCWGGGSRRGGPRECSGAARGGEPAPGAE